MRLFVSHAFHNLPSAGGEAGADSQSVPEWELKIEGRPLDEVEPVSAHIVCMKDYTPAAVWTSLYMNNASIIVIIHCIVCMYMHDVLLVCTQLIG